MAIEFSAQAYAKLMLHVRKHPVTPANGYLLGSVTGVEEDEPVVSVTNAVPLFHSHTLAPGLEVATQMVDGEELRIVGYYHSNERADDDSVALVSYQICDKLDQESPGAALVQVAGRVMGAHTTSCKPQPPHPFMHPPDHARPSARPPAPGREPEAGGP